MRPTVYGIRVTGPCKVSGKHLSEAPNTALSEEELLAIDRDFAAARLNGSIQQAEDARALRQQVHMQGVREWSAR